MCRLCPTDLDIAKVADMGNPGQKGMIMKKLNKIVARLALKIFDGLPPTMMLRNYLKYHERFHHKIVARLAMKIFDGLPPGNVFNFRSEFFLQNVNKNDVVIDIGCGTGSTLSRISPLIRMGYGIEYSKDMLAICKSKHSSGNIEYIENDLFKIDYEELKEKIGYTVAIFSHILEHVEDVPALLSRVKADKLLIAVPSQENWYRQLLIHFNLPYFTDGSHYREYTREMLIRELALASYQVDFIGFNQEGDIICKATKK